MIQFSYFVIALLLGLIVMCVFVSISDFRRKIIPNRYLVRGSLYVLTVFGAMFVFLPAGDVLKGCFFSIMGALLGGLFLYPPYKLKQVAAGDVKLVMVLGLFLGMKGVIFSVLIGAMVGGIWALGLAWKHGGISHMWYNMKYMAKSAYLSGFKDMGWDLKSQGAVTMPYGVALSIGACAVAIEQLFLHYHKIVAI